MEGLPRTIGRWLARLVLVLAALALLLFVAIAIDNDGDTDLVFGGVVLAVAAALVAAGAFLVQRELRERRAATRPEPDPAEVLERAARGETVELRPRRRSSALKLLGSVVFSAVLVPFAILEPSVLTVPGALVFLFSTFVWTSALVPGRMYLRVGPEGIVSRSPLRTDRYAWDDVERFRVYEVSTRYATHRYVGFDLRHLTPQNQSLWGTIGRGMSGVDKGLPDTYGLDPERFAEVLDDLRDRYATERGPSPSELADLELARRAAAVDTSRRVVVTWVVAVACLAAFVLEATRYDLAPTAAELLEIGGAAGGSPWWSLLTANLLHLHPFHLVLNLLAWAFAGRLLEAEIGAPRMALLCLVAGLASMGLATILQPDAVTAGLSGIVFAALAWGVLRDTHRTRPLGSFAWAMLPIGVIYTFLSPGTSIGGHLGGLAAGLLLGWSLDRARQGG